MRNHFEIVAGIGCELLLVSALVKLDAKDVIRWCDWAKVCMLHHDKTFTIKRLIITDVSPLFTVQNCIGSDHLLSKTH